MNRLFIFSLIAIGVLLIAVSCSRKPFINHKLELNKVADNCNEIQNYFRLSSNIADDRFEFEKCLPADFDNDHISTERKGDTVVVNFNRTAPGQKQVVFKVVLDIDSYPQYNFLSMDGDTYAIAHAKN